MPSLAASLPFHISVVVRLGRCRLLHRSMRKAGLAVRWMGRVDRGDGAQSVWLVS